MAPAGELQTQVSPYLRLSGPFNMRRIRTRKPERPVSDAIEAEVERRLTEQLEKLRDAVRAEREAHEETIRTLKAENLELNLRLKKQRQVNEMFRRLGSAAGDDETIQEVAERAIHQYDMAERARRAILEAERKDREERQPVTTQAYRRTDSSIARTIRRSRTPRY